MNNILLTGFEPFGNWDTNPTEEAAKTLDGYQFGGYTVIGRVLPLRFVEIQPNLQQLVSDYQPKAVILSGQAGGDKIRLERYAHNEAKSRLPYNCGTLTTGEVLEPDGKFQLHSSLPLQRYYSSLQKADIPVRYSDSAGRFGCNKIMYHARYDYPDLPTGFIHVPLLPQQVEEGKPSMRQDSITMALKIIVEETLDHLSEH